MSAATSAAGAHRPESLRVLTLLLLGSTLTVMAGALLSPVVELIRTAERLFATAAGPVLTVQGVSLALAGPAEAGWLTGGACAGHSSGV